MKEIDAALKILIAIDACDIGEYGKASEILEGLPAVIIRTRDAGVHFGHLAFIANAQHGTYRVVMKDARRLWSWNGANTLNEIALRGISAGRVSEPIVNVIPQVIEVIPCTQESERNLSSKKW